MEFQLHGYELTLRVADAEKIEVTALGIVGPDAEGGRSEESGANEGMEREDAEARKARPADRQVTPYIVSTIIEEYGWLITRIREN